MSTAAASSRPVVCENAGEANGRIAQVRKAGLVIGLVPTMGALHAGHLSLVRAACDECDFVAVSIFVNPAQFDRADDLRNYPRQLDQDLKALSALPVSLVFAPSEKQVYPQECTTTVSPPEVANTLEGEHRPGHFRGVATVVMKLFQIIPADTAYFGEKDFQQLLVIRHMVRDLNVPVRLRGCPIVREPDGLALSSRNAHLSAVERRQALSLSRGLELASQRFDGGERDPAGISGAVETELKRSGVDQIDYVAVRCAQTLQPLPTIDRPAVVLVAAQVGSTRLIDNRRIGESAGR